MKLMFAFLFLLSGQAFALPLHSYTCTSTAKFLKNNQVVLVDKKMDIAGYVDGVNQGLRQFDHSFKGHRLSSAIQIMTTSTLDRSQETYQVLYLDFYAHQRLTFESSDEVLPGKFSLSFDKQRKLSEDTYVHFEVSCKERE